MFSHQSHHSVLADTAMHSMSSPLADVANFAHDAGHAVHADTAHYAVGYTLSDELSPVALSGDYGDLYNAPDLSDVLYSDILNYYTPLDTLSPLALSGSYGDLMDVPEEFAHLDGVTGPVQDQLDGLQGQIDENGVSITTNAADLTVFAEETSEAFQAVYDSAEVAYCLLYTSPSPRD